MNPDNEKMTHGFRLLEHQEVKELNATAWLYYHEKSGARLLYLQNDDDNKVFCISFRTPPPDSTGVPHIMEHSVLCGSRKFPVKEPFVELAKGSLNTFLNAMTYPDKTMYPIASRNDKDFINLMDVYLDAVFYPNIYNKPEILMQEGWHYELEDKDQPLSYRGVVYNEMKGAFSSPEQVLFRKIQESLYPDTPYANESGGDPDYIPDLTQEDFIAFHRKYYHPSNSYIYLYGNGDMDAHLKFLNDEYLQHFDKAEIDSRLPEQAPFSKMRKVEVEYSISANENPKDKTYLSLNYSVGRSTDPYLYLAFNILEYLLLENPAAPLKKALLEAGIGKDVFGSFDNYLLQPSFSIVVKDANESDSEAFLKITESTLKDLVSSGIDKRLVEASINYREFKLREADFGRTPKGLVYGIRCMDSWLYDEDPLMHLRFEETLAQIKKALTEPLFEQLIEKYLLNNNHSSMVIVKPKPGLAEEKEKEIHEMLQTYKAKLSEKEIQEIIYSTHELRKKQSEPDSPEDLSKIPMIELSDIEPKAEVLPLIEQEAAGVKILHHPMFTNGIAYLNLWFDSSAVPMDLIPYAGLLTNVLGKISTHNYQYEELAKEINIHTGGIEFSIQSLALNGKDGAFVPKFMIRSKALISKLPKLLELLGEIIKTTVYQDKKRLKEIIQEVRSRMEMIINHSGNMMALNRLSSYFSPAGKYTELNSGIAYYHFLNDLERNFEARSNELIQKLENTAELIFRKNSLTVGITLPDEEYLNFIPVIEDFANSMPQRELPAASFEFSLNAANEGLLTPSKVQYVAKGYSFIRMGYGYSGTLQVLRTIANLDYLWNRVRIQGGAYGVSVNFTRSGMMLFASYRDPNLKETLDAYDGLVEYLSGFSADQREMNKYIIGTISRIDTPLTPQMKGEQSEINYFTGLSQEEIQRERDEILSTDAKSIQALASMVKDVLKNNYICVLGNEGKIRQNKDLFNNLVSVFG
ncbi:MAG TPA: insulinase family protein [Clostridiales bacterium]|nr:insulinase family protein [Clostridiales bacterium]